MREEINNLRKKIDKIDTSLITLVHQRILVTKKIGKVKKKYKLPIYDATREQQILHDRKKYAKTLQITPHFIENIFNSLLKESYINEENIGFSKLKKNFGSIVIIGGHGKMGNFFKRMLSLSGYQVIPFGRNDWEQSNTLLANASMIIISVPINTTKETIQQLPKLQKNCILIDLTSIKHIPLQTMLDIHDGPVLGLHPMFNPNISTPIKQTMIYCHGRHKDSYQWVLEQIKLWGINLYPMDSLEHDQYMLLVQSLRHFIHFSHGMFLQEQNIDLQKLQNVASPIYHIELMMIARLFHQDPKLCYDIITSSQNSITIINLYIKYINQVKTLIQETKEKKKFIKKFEKIQNWLGKYAKKLIINSDKILHTIK
ncbi:MAG: fused chorismate mutase/prephenate dehydrogenase [Candidatus Westeberhardia cardiocondylae]|nr:fused chorismate mutase/prephenate dehydrogenase [Candidatus Westeberhardia cardiocondylae]